MTFANLMNKVCSHKECGNRRWRPYSTKYCPYHFIYDIQGELRSEVLSWVRDRLCGVVNGYTRNLGPVSWAPAGNRLDGGDYSRDDIVKLYSAIPGNKVDPFREQQYADGAAAVAIVYPAKWDKARRQVPGDYEGPGARVSMSNSQARNTISRDYAGGNLNYG